MNKDFLVGIIFFLGLVIVGVFTVVIKDLTLLQGRSAEMSIVFDRVDGLEVGHKVLASGMEVGLVSDLSLQDNGKVKVDINLVKPINLYDGYTIKVKDASALGGKLIDIDVGNTKDKKLKPVVKFPAVAANQQENLSLKGKAKPSILDNPHVDELIVELKQVAKNLKGDGTIGMLIRDKEVYENILVASQNLKDITTSLKNAESTLGRLLYDDKLYKRLDRVMKNVDAITTRVRKGKGTLGRLLYDDKLYNKMKATMINAEKISQDVHVLTQRINRGEGTIGKLFMDDSLYRDLESTMVEARSTIQNINNTIRNINSGQGTLGVLLNDKEMAQNIKKTVNGLQSVVSRLEKGEGTIGKLMTDDVLYTEIRQLIKTFSDSVEDAREQVPITTFTNILFRAF